MTAPSDLKELLARVERATEADTFLDADLEFHLAPDAFWDVANAKPYTSSIDASLALVERVLPGWGWSVQSRTRHVLACCGADGAPAITKHPHWTLLSSPEVSGGEYFDATTPALSVCRSLLKALIAKENDR